MKCFVFWWSESWTHIFIKVKLFWSTLTSSSAVTNLSNVKLRMRDTWTPNSRCIPEHSIHTRTPRFVDNQVGSSNQMNISVSFFLQKKQCALFLKWWLNKVFNNCLSVPGKRHSLTIFVIVVIVSWAVDLVNALQWAPKDALDGFF